MNEKSNKGDLIIKIVAITLVVAALVGVILFMVFNKPKPYDNLDLSYVGKYNLESITGLTDQKTGKPITKDDYEFNYIELKSDGRYEIANKYKKNNKTTSQKGVWHIESGKLILESSRLMGLQKTRDEGQISKDSIILTITDKNDNKIILTLKK